MVGVAGTAVAAPLLPAAAKVATTTVPAATAFNTGGALIPAAYLDAFVQALRPQVVRAPTAAALLECTMGVQSRVAVRKMLQDWGDHWTVDELPRRDYTSSCSEHMR